MTKMVLNEVLDLLQDVHMVSSESDFSKNWLGKSECYLRTLRFNKVQPSIGAVAVCASKLQYYGNLFHALDDHKPLADRFLKLSNKCHKYVNERVGKRAKAAKSVAVYALT